ncbi:hypothetical protein R6Q59_014016 [Mikania micrantha]
MVGAVRRVVGSGVVADVRRVGAVLRRAQAVGLKPRRRRRVLNKTITRKRRAPNLSFALGSEKA